MRLPDLRNPEARFRLLLYGGVISIIGLFAFAAGLPLSSNPTFCGKACHSQNPEYQTWKKSSHAKITCYACHGDTSPPVFLRNKLLIDSMGLFKEIFQSYEKPINAESKYSQEHLPAARCKRCHANENRKFTFSKGIYMNHGAHDAAGIQCTVCHNRVVHKGAEEFEPLKSEWEEAKGFEYENFLTMKEGCFRCHSSNPDRRDEETYKKIKNGKKPPTACTTCHTEDFELPQGHGENAWRSNHGAVAQENFSYCFSCHDAGAQFDNEGKPWCTLCHDDSRVNSFKQQVVAIP